MSKIERAPARRPATSPHDPRYFDARDLEAELRRTFQICHECRMCVNYCGSFPELFKRIDRDVDGGTADGAEALDYDDFKAVSDECWQCKLCYLKCPYTDADDAYELLDYPRLMARERATRSARDGVSFVDQVLGEPQAIGMMGAGATAPLANLVNANRLVRKVQEKVTGISAEFPLPSMATEPFTRWFSRRGERVVEAGSEATDIAVFATCYGEYNAPNVARAAIRVLEHNGFRVHLPGHVPGQPEPLAGATCCGMPNLDGGDIARAAEKIRHNVRLLLPQVEAGMKVVALQPTCAYAMKREWYEYVPTPEVEAVAGAVVDIMELLLSVGRQKKLKKDFVTTLGTVAYHAACHLRAQKIGFPGARVLGVIPDTDVRVVEECSAVDGTWGMKARHYETGRRYAQKLVRSVDELEPDVVVSDCNLSGLRIQHETGRDVIHPVEALAKAYGLSEE